MLHALTSLGEVSQHERGPQCSHNVSLEQVRVQQEKEEHERLLIVAQNQAMASQA